MTARWQLYQRDHCHLCDQALAVLAQASMPAFDSRWIDHQPLLESLYGHRVPVLRDELTGRELDWPFDGRQLREFIEQAD